MIVRRFLGMNVAIGMREMFNKDQNKLVVTQVLAKYVDDAVIATRTKDMMEEFKESVSQAVQVGFWKQYSDVLDVHSTGVAQSRNCVTVSAMRLKKEIDLLELSPGRRQQIASTCTEGEIRRVRSLAEELGWYGVAVPPIE